MKITDLTSCTFAQALTLWNRGFEGYFSDVTMTMDKFIARFGYEGLSPLLSVVAWDDDLPIGFILNGVRQVRGKLVAWNGGTGVIAAYRGRGVGRRMMEFCLETYRKSGVDTAYLEAIDANVAAIELYKRMGYHLTDKVAMVHRIGPLSEEAFSSADTSAYRILTGLPKEVAHLEFYQAFAPWQSQWPSVTGGKSAILYDGSDAPVAYALYRHWLNDAGEVVSMALHQCEVRSGVSNPERVVRKLLREVFAPLDRDCRRLTVNLRVSNEVVMKVLQVAGFTTHVEQVFMRLDLNP